MTQTIRWGLLSTAHINRRLIPAIRTSKRGEMVAVASRDGEKAAAYAAEWSIPRAFDSYEAMLDSDAVDAVYISLPNHLHAEWTVRALEAGKHVLCEKPFAITLDQVGQMIDAQRLTGCVLQEGFMYRHHPQIRMLQEWLQEGRLGEVMLVRGQFSFMMSNRATNLRMVPEFGGGSLWDVGIYPLSFAQMVFGRLPASVFAQQWIGDSGVDEVFTGQLHYPDARAAQIMCGFQIPFATTVEVHGTLGRLVLTKPFTGPNERDSKMVFTGEDGHSENLHFRKEDPYMLEVENMNDAILDGAPTLVTLEESRSHVRVALALYESARSGSPVRLEP